MSSLAVHPSLFGVAVTFNQYNALRDALRSAWPAAFSHIELSEIALRQNLPVFQNTRRETLEAMAASFLLGREAVDLRREHLEALHPVLMVLQVRCGAVWQDRTLTWHGEPNVWYVVSILRRGGFTQAAELCVAEEELRKLRNIVLRDDEHAAYARFLALERHRVAARCGRHAHAPPLRVDPDAVLFTITTRFIDFRSTRGVIHYNFITRPDLVLFEDAVALVRELGFQEVDPVLTDGDSWWRKLCRNRQGETYATWRRSFRENCPEFISDCEVFAESLVVDPLVKIGIVLKLCEITREDLAILRAAVPFLVNSLKLFTAWTGRVVTPASILWRCTSEDINRALGVAQLRDICDFNGEPWRMERLRHIREQVLKIGQWGENYRSIDATSSLSTVWDYIDGDCPVETAFVYAYLASRVTALSRREKCAILMEVYGHRDARVLQHFEEIADVFQTAFIPYVPQEDILSLVNKTPPFGSEFCAPLLEYEGRDAGETDATQRGINMCVGLHNMQKLSPNTPYATIVMQYAIESSQRIAYSG